MDCFRLRSYDGGLPGNYLFKQNGPDGRMQSFPAQPTIESLASQISNWRKGNGMGRSSLAECIRDADRYQCQRLGNNATFCVPCNRGDSTAMAASNPYIAPPAACAGCGVTFKESV